MAPGIAPGPFLMSRLVFGASRSTRTGGSRNAVRTERHVGIGLV